MPCARLTSRRQSFKVVLLKVLRCIPLRRGLLSDEWTLLADFGLLGTLANLQAVDTTAKDHKDQV